MADKNRFEEIVDSATKAKKAQDKLDKQVVKYLLEVSIDWVGNPPEEYLDKDDVIIAKEFVSYMKKKHFVGAEKLKLERTKRKHTLSAAEMLVGSSSHSRLRRLSNLSRWLVLWRGSGYKIGIITTNKRSISPVGADVYLCGDGLLRCKRNMAIFGINGSYASGTGRVPSNNSELTQYSLLVGRLIIPGSQDDQQPTFKAMKLQTVFEEIINKNLI